MPDEVLVTYELQDDIALIIMRRGAKLNALNAAMRRQIVAAFERFELDAAAKVAILASDGRAFCAGADLREMADTSLGAPLPRSIPHLGRTFHVSKPTIAQVNGVAFAGGFLLAQMCDLCTASDDAEFALTEVRWGRGAPWATPLIWMLPQRVMMELLMTGQSLSARRAYELGFVNRLTSAEELQASTLQLARLIAANAPLGVKAGRELTYQSTEMGRSAALPIGDLCFAAAYESEDALEGPKAFRDGRVPKWKGK
ncbi:enoyl-CoA hydratase-related protein [soil metagenome]